MNSIKEVLINVLNEDLGQIIISKPSAKKEYIKIKIRPIEHKKRLVFHVEKFTKTQVFHENLSKEESIKAISDYALEFQQIQVLTDTFSYSILISRKGKTSITKKRITDQNLTFKEENPKKHNSDDNDVGELQSQRERKSKSSLTHNKKKNYILQEGVAVPFLVDLGVMTKEGRVVNSKYDKFRQINRFLEFIQDVIPDLERGLEVESERDLENALGDDLENALRGSVEDILENDLKRSIKKGLKRDRELRIIDFGCGKSYLTFAIYYYLHILKGINVRIMGIDLKEDVIDNCNKLAKKYEYDKLTFHKGDVADFQPTVLEDYFPLEEADNTNSKLQMKKDSNGSQIHMVISLHACDTATDIALAKAIDWGAKVILAVPCCQTEINQQVKNSALEPVLKYGLLKERFSSLATDGIRGGYLEAMGYKTQMLEFIDMEHTPKNVLIRGVKERAVDSNRVVRIKEFEEFLGVDSTIGKLMKSEGRRV